MKKSRATYRVFLAVALLLLLSLFPHHHHEGGAVCVVEEICAADGHANDEHTAHGAEHQRDSHYCYWQPASRLGQGGQHGWSGHGGWQPLALLPDMPGVPEISWVWLDGATAPSTGHFKAFCTGRPLSRRGPPLV